MLIAISHKKLLIEFHLRYYTNVISIVTPIVFPYQVVFVGCHEHDTRALKINFRIKLCQPCFIQLKQFWPCHFMQQRFYFFFCTFLSQFLFTTFQIPNVQMIQNRKTKKKHFLTYRQVHSIHRSKCVVDTNETSCDVYMLHFNTNNF